jgi:SAM-dependent methyltransferase
MKLKTENRTKTASIEFTLKWNCEYAQHTDIHFVNKVNFWRDLFPQKIYDNLVGEQEGNTVEFANITEDFIQTYDSDYVFDIQQSQFDRSYFSPHIIKPQFGRFYPKGLLKNIPGVFRGNIEPFRCVGIEDDCILVDFNHPLSKKDIHLKASVINVREKTNELGGMCYDRMQTITDGIGMQSRWRGKATDFFSEDPFRRGDESDDSLFYREPRFITHIDKRAISTITGIYGKFLKNGMNVLDLMSSWRSHIPEHLKLNSLVGLGLNEEEMSENFQLTGYKTHDLNKNKYMPFYNGEFDAVICTVSVEYLTHPFAVFEDVARVLKPGGSFIVTFSHRWFSPKVIRIWPAIEEFERVGLVLEYFLKSGKFKNLRTYSAKGFPRPEDDKYYPEFTVSDPIYAVLGTRD